MPQNDIIEKRFKLQEVPVKITLNEVVVFTEDQLRAFKILYRYGYRRALVARFFGTTTSVINSIEKTFIAHGVIQDKKRAIPDILKKEGYISPHEKPDSTHNMYEIQKRGQNKRLCFEQIGAFRVLYRHGVRMQELSYFFRMSVSACMNRNAVLEEEGLTRDCLRSIPIILRVEGFALPELTNGEETPTVEIGSLRDPEGTLFTK